jgi:hypothetical protein
MAASLAVEGNKISSAFSFLLHDVGTRLADSVRDVAESVMYNLCLDDVLKVAESIVIDPAARERNNKLAFVYDSDSIVSGFEQALAAVKANPSDASSVALKQALYKLGELGQESAVISPPPLLLSPSLPPARLRHFSSHHSAYGH